MKVYHKNTCITCKRTIAHLKITKKDLQIRDFFKDPFSEKEIKNIIARAKITPKEMLRKKDKMYKELDLEHAKKTDGQIIKLMVKHPGLIKRPIIITADKVTIGKTDLKQL